MRAYCTEPFAGLVNTQQGVNVKLSKNSGHHFHWQYLEGILITSEASRQYSEHHIYQLMNRLAFESEASRTYTAIYI